VGCDSDGCECKSEGSGAAVAEVTIYDLWSDLLLYPGEGYLAELRELGAKLEETHPEAMLLLASLTRTIAKLSVEGREEFFTRTFDINPVASLDIGWHLYGETYQRGSFLVEMRGLLRHYGVEESGELPDNLNHALRLLGRMAQKERVAFAQERVMPALDKIIEGFEGRENAYEGLLAALRSFLVEEVGKPEEIAQQSGGAFSV